MTDSRLRINRDVETEKAVQSQVWSRSIKIWSYGGGENNKQQPLAVPARETRCWDSHISLGPVTWPTDTSRVRALTRILSVNTPSLYLSPTMGDERAPGRRHQSVCHFSAPGTDITVVSSPSPQHWLWAGEAPDTRKQRSSCLGRHPDPRSDSSVTQWPVRPRNRWPHPPPPSPAPSCDILW